MLSSEDEEILNYVTDFECVPVGEDELRGLTIAFVRTAACAGPTRGYRGYGPGPLTSSRDDVAARARAAADLWPEPVL